jgi:hypothetical protein
MFRVFSRQFVWLCEAVLCLKCFLVVEVIHAQVTVSKIIDVGAGISDSTIRVTVSPSTANPTRAFDGNHLTEMFVQNSDTLVITLRFMNPRPIQKSKVFFWGGGKWLLESADSETDLNTKTGSYALLRDSSAFAFFKWDSATFARRSVQFIRLRARFDVGNVILGEWVLEGIQIWKSLLIVPNPPRLIRGATLQLNVKVVDDENKLHSFPTTDRVIWSVREPSIAFVDEDGKLTGVAIGTTEITASNSAATLKGKATVSVESDFRPQKVQTMTVKVALVIQDPFIQPGRRIHHEFGWRDPFALANRVAFHFREASDSVVNFQFVETIDATILFTRYYGQFLSTQQYVQLLREPGWTSLKAAAAKDSCKFDYVEMVKYYKFDEKRNNGQIDEVWVFAAPYLGMYESQLLGPNAFWWNSPPIRIGTTLTKLLSVMGLNYERGVDQAFHSFGHRVESAMVQAYFQAQGRNWNPKSPNPTPWDLFTRIEKDMPGQAHVGNVHYPPNGASDYDYGNPTFVTTYADNWVRYPYLFNQTRRVNVTEWRYSSEGGEPLAETYEHLGYLRWWYNHLPRYVGVTDGVLNNWWHYALDYEKAVVLANSTPVVGIGENIPEAAPRSYSLEQNFPNPFNPTTTIRYSVGAQSFVSLKVYDLLGREIATLVNDYKMPGVYSVPFDIRHSSFDTLTSGVYFYRIAAGNFVETKSMVLVK